MTRTKMLVRWVVAMMAAALAVLAAAAGVAAAESAAGSVVDVRPAPGEVVASGLVPVSAQVADTDGDAPVLVRVDGRDAGAVPPADEPVVVRAAPILAPGDHVAQVVVGREVLRAWRFTVSGVEVLRLSGSGGIATAVEVSRDGFRVDGTALAAVLAAVDDPVSALTGAPLAGAVDGPLLLTGREALAEGTATELRRLLEPGATVYLAGGLDALGEQVERAVAELGFTPERLAGADPAESAVLAARRVRSPERAALGRSDEDRVVVVAEDQVADAVALASPAAARGWPMLVTSAQELAPAARAYLAEAPPAEVIAVGLSGPAAAQLREVAGSVTRQWGRDRAETARAVAERFFDAPEAVGLADADEPAVALAGAAHAAGSNAPLLIVDDDLPEPLRAFVADASPRLAFVYGNPGTLAPQVVGGLRRAVADRGGAQVQAMTPEPGSEVRQLDQVTVTFDRDVLVAHSSLALFVSGREVPGELTQREPSVLVFTVAALPDDLERGRHHDLRIVGAVTDGLAWTHLDEALTWRTPVSLRRSP